MKKHLYICVALIGMLLATSCSRSNYTVLDLVPADAEFVAVISPTQICADAGVTITNDDSLQFPATFTDTAEASVVKDIDYVNSFLTGSVIDLDSIAVYLPTYDDKPVYVLKLKSADRFVNRITAGGYEFMRGQQGIKVYCKGERARTAVAIRGNIALLVDIEGGSVDDVWRWFYTPDENPMSRSVGKGSFVKGVPAKAVTLPADVVRLLMEAHPGCIDILLFAKTIVSQL